MNIFNVKKLTPSVERRTGEERRHEPAPLPNGDRRKGADRRGMRFGVMFKTSRSTDDIEDWLEDNCEELWSVTLEGIDEDLSSKTLRVLFRSEADKVSFSRKFSGRG